jgi:phenylpyruvate tautomerase PptA (4-oxalocrotonate tautomerase family)
LIEIEMIGDEPAAGLSEALAQALGKALESPAGSTWVRLRYLPVDRYGEDGEGWETLRPVFVTVITSRPLPDPAQSVRALAAAVASVTGRPAENVHIVLEPPGAGRVAFGGKLVD